MEHMELRREDFSVDDLQAAVRATFAEFFAERVPASVVRAAEPLGFDADLWRRTTGLGVPALALPESAGGDGATLVDLALVAEEHGRVLAPVPLVSQLVAARLLARAGAPATLLRAVAAGERLVAVALQPVTDGARRLVPDAALARDVLAWSPDGLALHTLDEPAPHLPNQGSTPLAWFDPTAGERTVLATGPTAQELFGTALAEWKLLTGAALVGLAAAALELGVEFARTRRTLGVPIGTLQGVSFPLVDVAVAVEGARRLVWKAAWYAEHEPHEQPAWPFAAFDYALRTATAAAWVSAHTQGGLGFTVEADISLYFLRAKGWGVLGGDPGQDRRRVAAARLTTLRGRAAGWTSAGSS